MENNRHWKIIQTKTGAERKVSEQLRKNKIEHYLPLCRLKDSQFEHKQAISPLIPKFVFAFVSTAEEAIIKNMDGVKGWVYYHDRQACITAAEINMMKRFIHEHKEISLEKIAIACNEMQDANPHCDKEEKYKVVPLAGNLEKIALPSMGFALTAAKVPAKVDVIRISCAQVLFSKPV